MVFVQHHQLAHPRTLSRYSETKYCYCEAKWKSYFRVGQDYRFWKQCTVHGVRAIPCNWGLHTWNNFSFAIHLPNILQEIKS